MTNQDFEKRLRRALAEAPSAACPEALCTAARAEAGRRRRRIGFGRFAWIQVRFLGWKIWAAQALLALAVWLLLGREQTLAALWRPQAVAEMLCVLSVLVFMAAPPLLYRSVRFRMHETEAASYFSSARLLMARLLMLGIGNVLLLGSLTLAAALHTALRLSSAAMAVWMPFLLAGSGGLYLLGHASPQWFLWGSLAEGGILLAAMFSRRMSWLFTPSPAWAAVCAVLLLFCGSQLHRLLRGCVYAEGQLAEA